MKKADIEKKLNKITEALSEKLNKKVVAIIRFNDWVKADKNRTYINVTFDVDGKRFAYGAGYINNQTKRYNKGYGDINLNGECDFRYVTLEMLEAFTPAAEEVVVTEEAAEEAAEEILYKKEGKEYIIRKGKGEFREATNSRYRRYRFVTREAWRPIIRENGKECLVNGLYHKERWEALMDMGYCFEEAGIPLTQEMKDLGCWD